VALESGLAQLPCGTGGPEKSRGKNLLILKDEVPVSFVFLAD
jgi:hypothetical protein